MKTLQMRTEFYTTDLSNLDQKPTNGYVTARALLEYKNYLFSYVIYVIRCCVGIGTETSETLSASI